MYIDIVEVHHNANTYSWNLLTIWHMWWHGVVVNSLVSFSKIALHMTPLAVTTWMGDAH